MTNILEYTKRTTPETATETNSTSARNEIRKEVREYIRYIYNGIKLAREINLCGDKEKDEEDFYFLCRWLIKFGLNNE